MIKNSYLFGPRPPLRTSKLQEKHSALEKEIQHFKIRNILTFFIFVTLWDIFNLFPPGSASIRLKSMRIRIDNTDQIDGLRVWHLFFCSFQRSQLCSSLSRLSIKTSDPLLNPARVAALAASAVACSHSCTRKNPRKSTLVTVMCLCVYVCIPAHKNRQIQSEMRGGKSRRGREGDKLWTALWFQV